MRGKLRPGIAAFAALAFVNGGNVTGAVPKHHCEMTGSEKLPSGTQLGDLCTALERAVAARAPMANYSATINVLSASRLTATLVVNGKVLPDQKFAVMDGSLSRLAIEHFANGLSDLIVRAAAK